MTKVFIDTLFVIALINSRDQHHERALALAKKYEGCPLLTTEAILLEIGNALARHFKSQSVDVIDQFRQSEEVEIVSLTPSLFKKGFMLYRAYTDKSWGLVDCISFIVMQDADTDSALTFDQHFVQAGFKALMRDDPYASSL